MVALLRWLAADVRLRGAASVGHVTIVRDGNALMGGGTRLQFGAHHLPVGAFVPEGIAPVGTSSDPAVLLAVLGVQEVVTVAVASLELEGLTCLFVRIEIVAVGPAGATLDSSVRVEGTCKG